MLTKNEISTLSLSPTKKDFVQIWNELLEVAGKLSERWDPTSTNESDPGIVILKALAGIADKLNYNIDKNTLEAFMPTAAQEDSMRKLCDMLGYNMKYYRSAETEVTIKYYNSDPSKTEEEDAITAGLEIPKFTVITNADKDISYFTTNALPMNLSKSSPSVTLKCMEGQVVKCESTVNNNVITLAQLSAGNKFYLPETQIAENGIFIYNVTNSEFTNEITDGATWEKVDNLNVQSRGSRVFKFGYSSYDGRPYVEFPEDCSELINEGLFIYYTRTSGANGNVSVNTLTQIELPTGGNWSKVSAESFSATNTFAATSGANLETIGQAYNNFKKTVGTFETLVTCRDYMNKIYTMVSSTGKPYVSNVLVTDIRNDLNRAITICSCDDAGIYYKETPLTETTTKTFKVSGSDTTVEVDYEEPKISHFDLVIYPFKSYTQIRSISTPVQSVYDASFTYTPQNFNNIKIELQNTGLKTIAHNFKKPQKGDILSINNYLRLNAIVSTNNKVSAEEALLLKERIKIALANAFNMRELDFGEEIPFESIVDVIEHADSRIRMVSLNEPDLYTTFTVVDDVDTDDDNKVTIKEYAVASEGWLTAEQATASKRFETDTPANGTFDTKKARELYNKLVVRNILAGRVPLFKYNTTYASDFSEKPYQVTNEVTFESLPNVCQTYFSGAAADAPYLLWCDGTKPENLAADDTHVYGTGDVYARELVNPDAVESTEKYKYTKTETPKELVKDANDNLVLTSKYPDNIVKPDEGDKITKIKSEFKVKLTGDQVKDLTLAAGEQIKFRAPNFRTKETYPAYVNYHLHLIRNNLLEAKYATATSLANLMTHDLWVSLFESSDGIVTQELKQEIVKGDTSNQISNIDTKSLETILYESGCIKFSTTPSFSGIKADAVPNVENFTISADNIPGLVVETDDTVLIHTVNTLNKILGYINSQLNSVKDKINEGWSISYEIQYAPVANLAAWEKFVIDKGLSTRTDGEAVLWRKFKGSYYAPGKYILNDGSKLLPFTAEHLGSPDTNNELVNRLQGIYIASDLGTDAEVAMIPNDTEYKLRENEYLAIKYTPSSTSEDGTTESQPPVTKIIKNTIIRPAGFTNGLKDSTAFKSEGNTPVATADFKSEDGRDSYPGVSLYSLGVNEQIEIRERSAVTLDQNTFAGSIIYIYKNFSCPELETVPSADVSQGRRSSTYILKEGEYIFYTDKNKSELAYYSVGTGVTLTGNMKLPVCDIIDISTILDNGISEIPWKAVSLTGESGITFQEYQYKTLSQDDTLNTLKLIDSNVSSLDGKWRKCADVSYTIAGETKPEKLPVINIADDVNGSNGWEVQSLLEINASPSVGQVLRNTDQVQTKITLYGIKKGDRNETELKAIGAELNYPLSFKTNVTGQSNTGELALSDVYLNPDSSESFTFKVTAEETPAIIEVQKDTILPTEAGLVGSSENLSKGVNSWSQVLLKNLGSTTDTAGEVTHEALKLSATILPNTYGLFSIYLKPNGQGNTYLKLLPGAAKKTIEIFNDSSREQTAENCSLELVTGLNCIRVNKSCEIYITSEAPDGLLCYDELRLVDVSYTDDNKVQTTYGLNLEQLGYLSTSDAGTWNEIDSRARKNLKNALTKEALDKVESRLQELNNNVAVAQADLDTDKPKVETIKKFLAQAISELATLEAKDGATISSLINQFNDLETALTNEKDLQKSLEDNTAIEDITKRLAELLEGFDDIASLQEGLTAELTNLYNSVLTNTENIEELSQDDIVDDYNKAISISGSKYLSDPTVGILRNALKVASLAKIKSRYDDKLEYIASELIASQENELAKTIYTLKYGEISDLLTSLVETLLSTEANSLEANISDIYSVVSATGRIDYSTVAEKLLALRKGLKVLNITAALTKVNAAAEENLYADLIEYLAELNNALDFENNSLIKAIDNVLTLVYSKTDTSSDAEIISLINNIRTTIWAGIKAKADIVKTELTKIANLITKDTVLDLLEKSTAINSAVLAEQLDLAITERSALEAKVQSFTNIALAGDDNNLPFGTESIVAVWPEYMKKELLEKVEPLYNDIHAIVRDLENNDDIILTVLDNRPVLKKLANITLFKKLYKRAKDLAYKSAQVDNRKVVIEELSARALDIPDVMDKLNEFIGTESEPIDDANKLVIYNLATQLKNTDENDVIAQQQILTALNEELTKLITLDESLLEITAEMLSPSILLLKDLPEDVFYNNVRTYINGSTVKPKILSGAANFSTVKSDLEGQLSLINNFITSYDNNYSGTLLPASYTLKVTSYQNAKAKIPANKKATEWDIFKILLDENLKAAWKVTPDQGIPYWIDSEGATITLSEDYKYRYYDNTWYELIGAEEVLVAINTSYADEELVNIITTLIGNDKKGLKALGAGNIPESFRKAFEREVLELQLLDEIRALDKNHLFYYNTPVESNVAIDFNEGDSKLNTLMNPATNYDINNVNNSFVISKLDIGYLDSGIQIARSSRL